MTASTTYDDVQAASAPANLQRPIGQRWNVAFGLLKEAFKEAARQAIYARFPSLAPESALDRLGRVRLIDKGWGFTAAQFRQQLLRAFDIWQAAGTKQCLIDALTVAGYTDPQVKESWEFGGGEYGWNAFWVLLYPPFPVPTSLVTWDDSRTWQDDDPWINPIDDAEVARIRRIVARLKPTHARCVYIAWVLPGQHFFGDPGLTFGSFSFANTIIQVLS